MANHLKRRFGNGVILASLLVLTPTVLFKVTHGQQQTVPNERRTSKRKAGASKSTPSPMPPIRRGVVTIIASEPKLIGLEEDPEVTISLHPCKGEQPGNVLGISEQLKISDRAAAFGKKLGEPDLKTRACAARQLGYLGPEAKDAVPHLIKLIHDETNSGVWRRVEEALWAIGPERRNRDLNESKAHLSELLELSKAPDVYIRLYAAFVLGYFKPVTDQKVIVEALVSATKDEDGIVRWMALKGLGRLGPIAKDAVPVLIPIIQAKDRAARMEAMIALGRIGPDAAQAVPALLDQLYHSDDDVMYRFAAIALGRIGPVILPLLQPKIESDPFRVLDVLEDMGPAGASLTIEALRSKNKKVQKKAIGIIGWHGQEAEPAVPLLVEALKDQDEEIRSAAATSLGHLGPVARTAVAALAAVLNDKNPGTQCWAASALGEIGPDAKPTVPDLLRLMNLPIRAEDDVPQRCAAEALMKMSPGTRAQVPAEMVKRVEAWYARLSQFPLFEADETRPKPKPKKKENPVEIN